MISLIWVTIAISLLYRRKRRCQTVNLQRPDLFSMRVSDAYIGFDENMRSSLQTLVCGLRLWQVEQNLCFGSIILLLWITIPKISKTCIELWTFLNNFIIGVKTGTWLYWNHRHIICLWLKPRLLKCYTWMKNIEQCQYGIARWNRFTNRHNRLSAHHMNPNLNCGMLTSSRRLINQRDGVSSYNRWTCYYVIFISNNYHKNPVWWKQWLIIYCKLFISTKISNVPI